MLQRYSLSSLVPNALYGRCSAAEKAKQDAVSALAGFAIEAMKNPGQSGSSRCPERNGSLHTMTLLIVFRVVFSVYLLFIRQEPSNPCTATVLRMPRTHDVSQTGLDAPFRGLDCHR